MHKYTYNAEDGTWSGEQDTDNEVTNEASNGAPEVSISKTITPTGAENLFNITLEVETTQKIQITETYSDAAVALSIDTSAACSGIRTAASWIPWPRMRGTIGKQNILKQVGSPEHCSELPVSR